ncbi:sensor histidine kinase [Nocardioides zeae]|uniref:histidine kinase n=1 Tax=Nocardioides imazamoxiresistens TaxID=3231893 RepID=A0ABU3PX76_9ACTN|nr:sensor histidine kinase [Nocardioides zeae]MDT9593791.1 sensor histidine kinase [Nocardioides zeae]
MEFAARALAVVATTVPLTLAHDGPAIALALSLSFVILLGLALSVRVDSTPVLLAEAAALAILGAYSAVSVAQLPLAALAIIPFVAGLRRGLVGLLGVVTLQVVVVATSFVAENRRVSVELASDAVVGVLLGIGLGLIALFVRSTLRARDALAPYHEARLLLQELLGLSDTLQAGLDPQAIGARTLAGFQDVVPSLEVSLWAGGGRDLAPIVTGSLLEAVDHGTTGAVDAPPQVEAALRTRSVVLDGDRFAVPLSTIGEQTILAAGHLSPSLALSRRSLAHRLRSAAQHTHTLAAQLDTALLFSEVSHAATRNERRRLAREMHDGVAQDIASMGYLVDAIVDGPLPDDVRPQIELLRGTITRVVAEVRTSVTALRMDADAAQSLGEAVAGLARRLSESSGISIRCTVEERTVRLRPEVEAELLRIAQEAMTNAVKHAGASEIDVECRVDAPRARLVVRDNGRGLGPGRADSHGLTIMRERAQLVGAHLTIDSTGLGTVIHVNLGSRRSPGAPERPPGARP